MAESPEQSEFTSIAERTDKLKQGHVPAKEECNPSGLHPFAGYPPKSIPKGLPFRLKENLELVDWTGRAILEYMRGYIPYASGNHIFTAGTQLCGNSSSIALALCVGNR
ncbi:MAG: hypothetical protein AB2652_20105, partial [Candidatus Thiodiazotropha endolucinida]